MSLNEIFAPVSRELGLVKQELKQQLDTFYSVQQLSHDDKAHVMSVVNHFFSAPGKGLRPALVVLAAQLAEAKEQALASSHAVIQFATAVELFHSASLVHDDIVDRAEFRRNQQSINGKYGNHIAVVVGDGLILEAFSLLFTLEASEAQKGQVFRIMRSTLQKMCLGELCEHRLLSHDESADVEEYVGLLDKKTATLMSACCECSAILSGNTPKIVQRLSDFGTHFGIAFQVADDLKDQDALLKQGIDLIPIIRSYVQKAKDDLSFFPDIPARKSLTAVCDMLLPAPDAPGMFDRQ